MRILPAIHLLVSLATHTVEKSCCFLLLDGPQKLQLFDSHSSQDAVITRMSFSPIYEVRADALALALITPPNLT